MRGSRAYSVGEIKRFLWDTSGAFGDRWPFPDCVATIGFITGIGVYYAIFGFSKTLRYFQRN
ncbi:hypothetical protein BMS3Bbin06_01288 [bacterium BMS3Bbin06]|nr:hypothetical protein BMS3Abin08_01182 [bacterium BMS3Abin08]GBE34758.1 hypothetical protein BMS3Bbin06_01288 [bacterium BMS3Bbin06]HDO36224.1 hypothetical protein [Nitrospirota bacterium]HDY72471.1 hypothetical protein [Nitrospirota bacterium]